MDPKRGLSIHLPGLLTVFALLFAPIHSADAQTKRGDIQFNRDIRPLLSDRCFQCHGPDDKKREAGLRLDFEASALKDLGSGRAIVPYHPEQSLLIERIFSEDKDERMPPPDSGKSLSDAERQLLKHWIESGAVFEQHWAFQEIVSPRVPVVKNTDWVRNPIDAFILAKLEAANLQPSPEASRETLIRRLSIDLTGLLPSPQDVQRFVNDPSTDAYEKLVDRLLESKHFGERMGRHWLDLARYADSNGYANDGLRSIWPYRDWVIRAINSDMPFDQFTIEQLAGDLLPDPTQSQLIATGFQRNTPHQTEGGSDPEQYRVERTKNRTDTVGAVWLGLTVGCAQCHSHKFDPISQAEYYQLYAFFNDADEPTLPLQLPPETASEIVELEKNIANLKRQLQTAQQLEKKQQSALQKKMNWQTVRFDSSVSQHGATLTPKDDGSILVSGKNPDQDSYHLVFQTSRPVSTIRLETLTDPSLPKGGPGRAGNGNFVLAELRIVANGKPARISAATADHSQSGYDVQDAFDNRLNTGWAINVRSGSLNVNRTALFALAEPIGGKIELTMITYEQGSGYNIGRFRIATSSLKPKKLEGRVTELKTGLAQAEKRLKELRRAQPTSLVLRQRSQPRPTHVQIRGDFLDRGPEVQPATPAVLPPLKTENSRANRLDLARWIVSRDNPLTPRVVANRIWQQLFGIGLVETENDFGYQGKLPDNRELLDYLARDLVDHEWKMKRVYRQIVLSATYRQSSGFRADALRIDPRNKLLARQNRFRVEGEIVRDLALCASGLLSRKMGGPAVFPPIPPNVIGTSSANHRWPESKGEDRYRRGIYTAIYRANVYPMLSVFDGPDRDNACTRRSRSNTPLQALTLANDSAFMEMAVGFGKRIIQEEASTDPADRIQRAFAIAFGRLPSAAETERLKAYYNNRLQWYQSNRQQAQVLCGERDPELAAWVSVARVLLNLDEFITRE